MTKANQHTEHLWSLVGAHILVKWLINLQVYSSNTLYLALFFHQQLGANKCPLCHVPYV